MSQIIFKSLPFFWSWVIVFFLNKGTVQELYHISRKMSSAEYRPPTGSQNRPVLRHPHKPFTRDLDQAVAPSYWRPIDIISSGP